MNEIITIDGVREPWRKREKGEKLPDNWPDLIRNYIKMKESSYEKLGSLGDFWADGHHYVNVHGWELKLIKEAKAIRRALYVYY